jgi:uncharacterized protein
MIIVQIGCAPIPSTSFLNILKIISFLGGEPLLKFDVIKHIVNSFNTLKKGKRKITYLIVTNGTIVTSEIIEFCKSNNVVFQITLDGKEEAHDQHRIYKNGAGTFNKITSNIRKLKDCGVNYYLRTNITAKSEYPKQLLEYYRALGVAPPVEKPNNGIVYGIVTGLSREETDEFLKVFDFDKLANSMFESFMDDESENKLTYHVNILKIFNSFIFTNHIKRSCGLFNNRINIKYDGTIYPCHKWVNNLDLSIGTVWEGLNNSLDEDIQVPVIEKNPTCRECEYKYFCGGFCHYNSLFNKDSVDGPYCRFTKSLTRLVLKYIVDSYEKDKKFFLNIVKGSSADYIAGDNKYYEEAFMASGGAHERENDDLFLGKSKPKAQRSEAGENLLVTKSANVSCIDLGDKGVLVSTTNDDFKTNYIANVTSMAIWDLVDNKKTAKQIADKMAVACEKGCEEIEEDIYNQIAIFERLGFVELKKDGHKIAPLDELGMRK